MCLLGPSCVLVTAVLLEVGLAQGMGISRKEEVLQFVLGSCHVVCAAEFMSFQHS